MRENITPLCTYFQLNIYLLHLMSLPFPFHYMLLFLLLACNPIGELRTHMFVYSLARGHD